MVLGSHNAWSFLKPRKWWMKLIGFTAKCQKCDIQTQYEKYGVRCFDLRLRFDKDGTPMIVHGPIEYEQYRFGNDLMWLDGKDDAIVRILLDTRSKKQYTDHQKNAFTICCAILQQTYKNIKFCEGRDLYTWKVNYDFCTNVTFEELYSSVCPPKIVDDWLPWFYAKLHNRKNIQKGTDKDVLLIDFVNIQ